MSPLLKRAGDTIKTKRRNQATLISNLPNYSQFSQNIKPSISVSLFQIMKPGFEQNILSKQTNFKTQKHEIYVFKYLLLSDFVEKF